MRKQGVPEHPKKMIEILKDRQARSLLTLVGLHWSDVLPEAGLEIHFFRW